MLIIILLNLYLLKYKLSQAQSLTCDNTTSACPGTEVTLCTCSITGVALSWTVPGAGQLSFDDQDGVGAEKSEGAYTAVITDETGDRVSVLTYNATATLMNGDIECNDLAGPDPPPTTVTVTFAGKE